MIKKILVFFISGLISLSVFGTSRSCLDALKVLFATDVDKKEAGEFLKLQSDITLHRLAWTYLKAQKEDQHNKVKTIEKTILDLLNQKYTSSKPEFIKARKAFEAQPLSRSTLAEIAPYLQNILIKEFGEESKPFQLNASDLKLLAVIAKKEKATKKNGVYDHRMFTTDGPQGVMNFVKMINHDYGIPHTKNKRELNIDMKLSGLDQIMSDLQNKMNDFFDTMNVPQACQNDEICDPSDMSMSELFMKNNDIQNVLWESITKKLHTDDELFEDLSYGDLWLKVKHTKKPRNKTGTSTKVSASTSKIIFMDAQKNPVHVSSPSRPAGQKRADLEQSHNIYVSDVGLMIQDPLKIIKREQKAGLLENIEKQDLEFQQKMASAIMSEDKIFENKGKLYKRSTGEVIVIEDALNLLPPARRALYRSYITSDDEDYLNSQVKAMLNGDETFVHKGQLYNLQGMNQNPATIIVMEMRKKGMDILAEDLKSENPAILLVRANAIRNSFPYYTFENQTYDSITGKNPSSPFSRQPAAQDVKVEKNRRKSYQYLSDEEIILNYHRDFPSKDCGHYIVVSKRLASLKVYALNGIQVFETEVLVGSRISDQRTRFTKATDFEKLSNKTTGAGVFTVDQLKNNNDYYKENFNNNLFSLSTQTSKDIVFAIHQVPTNLPERYKRFGTGNPADRRVTGGCVNLKEKDFETIKKWMGPACKVYVLPEEEGNHFVLKNGQINLFSENPVPIKDLGLYNFNSTKSSRPIQIKITNPQGKTKDSEIFVNTLVSEKSTLMKALSLDNDDYNDLAMMAYAVMGNESDFGRSEKYFLKENTQWLLSTYKDIANLFIDKKYDEKNSRGFTQIKFLPAGEWRNKYPDVKDDNLGEPKNAAIATMAYLADAMVRLKTIAEKNKNDADKVQITRENRLEYLAYIYMGRSKYLQSNTEHPTPDENVYIQNLRRNMSYLEITQQIE